jgi:site-specific DNA-methyltransferase (adenine-specific)
LHGKNLDILPTLADNSVDSIVTDPPYELGFMGKGWDSSGIAYSVQLWTECLRVLKPGGHLLSFGGTRTFHRVAVAIEDAGFEIRDNMAWLYGSGFPKSLDVSKAIDKAANFDGEVIGTEKIDVGMQGGSMHTGRETKIQERKIKKLSTKAQQWNGWGTALKPAHEPIIVARKPLIGTVAHNVLTHGTGALNIDGSRIGAEGGTFKASKPEGTSNGIYGNGINGAVEIGELNKGRWPANIIFDEHTAGLLDEQSGVLTSGALKPWVNGSVASETVASFSRGLNGKTRDYTAAKSSGGASRFFYVAKASKRDRNEGLDDFPLRKSDTRSETAAGLWSEMEAAKQNFHPTVKPTALMEYLVKLVTPPNGTVLDPFTGSGSTGKAAILNGFDFIGIEMTEDYLPIIKARLQHAEATYGSQIRMD